MRLRAALVLICAVVSAEDAGKIMRPADKSAFRTGPIEVVATAPGGSLELDGVRLSAEQPFPNILHTKVEVQPGTHTLTLLWPDGKKQIQFYAGSDIPAGFTPFRTHPPNGETPCTQCHQMSKRGRFVFHGGCFDCHNSSGFAKVHTHTSEVLSECGLCHNAHGSIVKSHLLYSKDIACKQCHN